MKIPKILLLILISLTGLRAKLFDNDDWMSQFLQQFRQQDQDMRRIFSEQQQRFDQDFRLNQQRFMQDFEQQQKFIRDRVNEQDALFKKEQEKMNKNLIVENKKQDRLWSRGMFTNLNGQMKTVCRNNDIWVLYDGTIAEVRFMNGKAFRFENPEPESDPDQISSSTSYTDSEVSCAFNDLWVTFDGRRALVSFKDGEPEMVTKV